MKHTMYKPYAIALCFLKPHGVYMECFMMVKWFMTPFVTHMLTHTHMLVQREFAHGGLG